MKKLTPPAVPLKLRELLKDYPEHIERLQEVLNEFGQPKPRLQPFDEALWALQGRLETFFLEAEDELKVAEAGGSPLEIEAAADKSCLMSRACSRNGGMRIGRMDDLWNFFEENKQAFEPPPGF